MFMLGRVSIASTVVRPGNGTPEDTAGTHARKRESHQSSLQSKDDDLSWKAKKSDYEGRQDTNATVAQAPVVLADSKFDRPPSSAQGFAGLVHEDSVESGWPSEQSPRDDDHEHTAASSEPKMDIIKADAQQKPLQMAGRRRKALVGVPESLRRKITPSKDRKGGDGNARGKTSTKKEPITMKSLGLSERASDGKESTPQKDSCKTEEVCRTSIKAKQQQQAAAAKTKSGTTSKRNQTKKGAHTKKRKLEPVRTSTRKASKVASKKLKHAFASDDEGGFEDVEGDVKQEKDVEEPKPAPASDEFCKPEMIADQGQKQQKKRTPPPRFDAKDRVKKKRLQELIDVHRSALKSTREQMNAAASPKSSTPLQMEAQPQQGGNTPIKAQKTRLGVAPKSEKKVHAPPVQSVSPRKQAAKTLGDMHNLYSNESEEDEEVEEGKIGANILGTKNQHGPPAKETSHNPACPDDDDDFTALDALNTAMSKVMENHSKLSDTICNKKYSLLQTEMKHALETAYANSKLAIVKAVQKSETSCAMAINAFEAKVSYMQSYVDQHLAMVSTMQQECHLLQQKAQDMIESSRISMEQSHANEMESIQRSHELIHQKYMSGLESINHYKKQMTPSYILN